MPPWLIHRRFVRRRQGADYGDPPDTDKRARRERQEFLTRARAMTPYVAAVSRDLTFLVPTLSDAKLFLRGDVPEFRVLDRAVSILRRASLLPESPTIVDVGAHIGTTTIAALAHHGFAHAIAIEPDPENVKLLRANVALNDLGNRVTEVSAAASDVPGQKAFKPGRRDQDAYHWMKGRLTDEPSPDALAVETVTLDQLAQRGILDPPATGLLWVDCQKHEEHVLRAATELLERRVPIVFAFRPHLFDKSSPLVEQLTDVYDQVVHLRRRAPDPQSSWQPEIRSIAYLGELCRRKASTDVLVASGLEAAV